MSASTVAREKGASVFSTGLALFSMFFGAGNLIFPLLIGKEAGSGNGFAVLGLGLSAVAFPFLGLIAMMFYGGDLKLFLARLGKWPAFLVMAILYMSQGPVGAMPRHFTLMHASLKPYFPGLSLFTFSLLLASTVFCFAIRPRKMIQWLGKILTPLLLFTLALLVVAGLYCSSHPMVSHQSSMDHFVEGLKGGYQTLDLTAALLFATIVFPHLMQPRQSKEESRKKMMMASLIAASLLMAAYIGLCTLSADHSWTLGASLLPEDLLHGIAHKVLGPAGGIIATGAVFLACLTTNVTLAALFAEYVREAFFQGKGGVALPLALTLGITAFMANLGFSGIMQVLGPILEIVYPGLILLCLLNISIKLRSTT